MIKSCDVGSLPLRNDVEKFLEGAKNFSLYPDDDSVKYFEKKVIEGFLDKVEAGMNVPNYPQFRDMNEMFLAMLEGVEKMKDGYIETKTPSVTENRSHIPELTAIKRNSQIISEKKGEPFQVKVCVTGPYTLSSLFIYRDNEIFGRLGNTISQIVENNIFSGNHGSVGLVAVDEPVFGMLDDPLIDYGSEGRENLLKAWEAVFHKVMSKNVQALMHLHNTSDGLFWEVKSLNIIDSHTDDPIYQMKKTKEQLDASDKFLKASICSVEFDTLIYRRIIETSQQKMTEPTINEKIAEVWTDIKSQKTDPKIFVESIDLMNKHLVEIVGRFGMERVPYAGPECGPKGFPSYECALECLRRVASTVKSFNEC
jgi:5-methyltetrahydropteroyltriglutamate--homocysteine methyltransferase